MTTRTATTPRRLRTAGGTLFFLLAVGITVFAVTPYLSGDPANSAIDLNPNIDTHFLSLVVHSVFGGTALILGPLQLSPAVRRRFPRFHTVAGRIYMGAVAVSACVALFSAAISVSGFDTQVAFTLLALGWIYTLIMGYRTIKRGDVRQHRVWMIRNYALTFAAVTLRLILLAGLGAMAALPWLEFEDVYRVAAWGSILTNIVVAEYFIVHRTTTPDLPTPTTTPAPAPAPAPANMPQ